MIVYAWWRARKGEATHKYGAENFLLIAVHLRCNTREDGRAHPVATLMSGHRHTATVEEQLLVNAWCGGE